MHPSNWADFQARHRVGDVVQGRVDKVVSFGAFVEVDGFHGLLVDPVSPAVGTVVSARILGIDPEQTRFSLSTE
jgi:ribosomal protein S1